MTYTEAVFTKQVLQLAKAFRWQTAHFRPAMTKQGWRTAVSGDGKGFPDVILVREKLVVAELKVGKGKPTPEQTTWLDRFRTAGVETYLWTPDDWKMIEAVLMA